MARFRRRRSFRRGRFRRRRRRGGMLSRMGIRGGIRM